MRFHDVCFIVSDLEKAIEMWTSLFDFEVDAQFISPDDGIKAGITGLSELMEDIWGIKGARTKLALLSSPGGAKLELQEPISPAVNRLPDAQRTYNTTGLREVCLHVEGIDNYFERVKAAGYRVQTNYVWPVSPTARTFIFYDHDGNLIQLWDGPEDRHW